MVAQTTYNSRQQSREGERGERVRNESGKDEGKEGGREGGRDSKEGETSGY